MLNDNANKGIGTYRKRLRRLRKRRRTALNNSDCRTRGLPTQPGDFVNVVMERGEEERTVEAPPELSKELAKNKKALGNWEEMSFTNKKEMASAISGAKQEKTRRRRIAKVMQLKSGAKWTG